MHRSPECAASAVAKPDAEPKKDSAAKIESNAKPRLGLLVMTISPELRTFFGSTDKTGVLVSQVEPGSPAALAGIAVGDVLQEVGDIKADEAADVPDALAKAPKDRIVRIKLLRDNKQMTLDVKLNPATSLLEWWPTEWLRQLFDNHNKATSG